MNGLNFQQSFIWKVAGADHLCHSLAFQLVKHLQGVLHLFSNHFRQIFGSFICRSVMNTET